MPPKHKPAGAAKKPGGSGQGIGGGHGGKGKKGSPSASDTLALLAAEEEEYRARVAAKKATKHAAQQQQLAAAATEQQRLAAMPDRWGRSLPGDVLVHLARTLLTDASSLTTLATICQHWCRSLFDPSVRTDSLWRRAFFTYWNHHDASSIFCNHPSPSPSSSSSSSSASHVSWRQRYQRRALVDHHWSIGRCERSRVTHSDIALICLDSLNDRMIMVDHSSNISLWSRGIASQLTRESLVSTPVGATMMSTPSPSPPLASSGHTSHETKKKKSTSSSSSMSTTSPPASRQWRQHSIIGNSEPTISDAKSKYASAPNKYRDAPYHGHRRPLAVSMNWSRGWLAVVYYYGMNEAYGRRWCITVTDLRTGDRVSGIGTPVTQHNALDDDATILRHDIGGYAPPSTNDHTTYTHVLPLCTWLPHDRLMVTTHHTALAVVWQPLHIPTLMASLQAQQQQRPQLIPTSTDPILPPSSSPLPPPVPQMELELSSRLGSADVTSWAIHPRNNLCVMGLHTGYVVIGDISATTPSEHNHVGGRTRHVQRFTPTGVTSIGSVPYPRVTLASNLVTTAPAARSTRSSSLPSSSSSPYPLSSSSTITTTTHGHHDHTRDVPMVYHCWHDQHRTGIYRTVSMIQSWLATPRTGTDGDCGGAGDAAGYEFKSLGTITPPMNAQVVCQSHGNSYYDDAANATSGGTTTGGDHGDSGGVDRSSSLSAINYWVCLTGTGLSRSTASMTPWSTSLSDDPKHIMSVTTALGTIRTPFIPSLIDAHTTTTKEATGGMGLQLRVMNASSRHSLVRLYPWSERVLLPISDISGYSVTNVTLVADAACIAIVTPTGIDFLNFAPHVP